GVLSVCFDENSNRYVASFIPRLGGGVLNEAGIVGIGAFNASPEARQALVERYGEPDAWFEGHPEGLHMRSHGPESLSGAHDYLVPIHSPKHSNLKVLQETNPKRKGWSYG